MGATQFQQKGPYYTVGQRGPTSSVVTAGPTGVRVNGNQVAGTGPGMYKPPRQTQSQPGAGGQQQPQTDPWANWSGMPQGWGEDWYIKNAYKYDQPTQSSQYWNGVQGWFANPTAQENQMGQYAPTGKSTIEGAWDRLYPGMQQPGAAENFYGQNQGFYTQPGDMQNWYRNYGGQFNGPGAAENYYTSTAGQLAGPSAMDEQADAIRKDIGSANALNTFWNTTGNPTLSRGGYTEGMAGGYRPEFSYSEQMLGPGSQGLDYLYSRLQDVQGKRLDDAAAARGGFNSGAALRAQQELGADLTGQRVNAQIALANQADAQKMARLAEGRQLMTSADEALRGRLGLGFQGAGQSDQSTLARTAESRALAGDIEGQRMERTRLGGELAKNAQSAAMDRLLAGGKMAGESQRLGLDTMTAGMDAAARAQQERRMRESQLMQGARDVDQAGLDRSRLGADIMSRLQQMQQDRMRTGAGLAGDVDKTGLDWLTSGQGAANSAQTMRQNRLGGNLDDLMKLIGGQVGTFTQGADRASAERFQAQMDELDLQLRMGNISKEQYDAQSRDLMTMAGIASKAALGNIG